MDVRLAWAVTAASVWADAPDGTGEEHERRRGPDHVDLLIRHGYVITMDDDSRHHRGRGDRDRRGPDRRGRRRRRRRRALRRRPHDRRRRRPGPPGLRRVPPARVVPDASAARSPTTCRRARPSTRSRARFYDTVNDEEEYLGRRARRARDDPQRHDLLPRGGHGARAGGGGRGGRAGRDPGRARRRLHLGPAARPRPGQAESRRGCTAAARARADIAPSAPQTRDEALARLGRRAAPQRRSRRARHGPRRDPRARHGERGADDRGEAARRRRRASSLNLHQSYSPADTAADRQRFGTDPLVHLAEIGFLDRNVTFGHANHLTDAECDVVLERDASLAWAPAASMLWGHGGSFHGRHAEFWRRGANIALGSDSANWSNDFDLFRQANLALLSARDAHGDRDLSHRRGRPRDGDPRRRARRPAWTDRIGSLEAGKRADIVIHTLDRPEIHPTTNMIRNLFYSSRSKSVHTVIVDGKVVLEQRRRSSASTSRRCSPTSTRHRLPSSRAWARPSSRTGWRVQRVRWGEVHVVRSYRHRAPARAVRRGREGARDARRADGVDLPLSRAACSACGSGTSSASSSAAVPGPADLVGGVRRARPDHEVDVQPAAAATRELSREPTAASCSTAARPRWACPARADTHPLHGELPNAPYQQGVAGRRAKMRRRIPGAQRRVRAHGGVQRSLCRPPEVRLTPAHRSFPISIVDRNLKQTPMDLMYLAHINFRPVDYGRLVYSAP